MGTLSEIDFNGDGVFPERQPETEGFEVDFTALHQYKPEELRELQTEKLELRALEFRSLHNLARLQDDVLPGHPIPPMHVVVSGPKSCGKRFLSKAYQRDLKRYGRFDNMEFHEVDGSSIELKQLRNASGQFVYVTNLRGLLDNPELPSIVTHLRSGKCTAVMAFAGDARSAGQLMDMCPELAPVIGRRIELAPFTTAELAVLFRLKMKPHFWVSEDGERIVRQVAQQQHLTVLGIEQWCARAVRAGLENARESGICRELPVSVIEDTAPQLSCGGSTALQRLNSLTGLEQVKAQVAEELALLDAQAIRERLGLPRVTVSHHMIFAGNPGTGKTEVARLVAEIFKERGLLSEGKLFEVGRQDLVAKHIGNTAPKVHELFQRARGSVIFIDEAYSLIPKGERDFAHEAVSTLIADMESYRDEVVVILAGYPNLMDQLMRVNPGFESRIRTRIQFPDYTTPQLLEIMAGLAADSGYILEQEAWKPVEQILNIERSQAGFGNARNVRQLFERAVQKQARRLSQGHLLHDAYAIRALTAADFESPRLAAPERRFGFTA